MGSGFRKAKRKAVEKEDEEKEEKREAQKRSLVNKAQRTVCEFPRVGKERRIFEEDRHREE